MIGFNIRQKQTDILLRLLDLNPSGKGTGSATVQANGAGAYKVLVLDKYSKDIIAPLVRLNELRKHGVTLHLMIEAERQAIPDVPAVYLVQPTNANVERIAADAAAGVYDTMYINFTAALPSRLLENLAFAVVRSDSLKRIGQIFDQYMSFISLEASLFSLGQPSAYVELNDPSAKDFQIETAVSSIVDGLFSVCVTLGVLPIIRCPKGGAAEHVAGALDGKLRDALRTRGGSNLFSDGALGLGAALTRPILCLFDRNFDLSSVLQHTWTYKPLVHDALGMRLNRVTLAPEVGPGPSSAAAAALAAKKSASYDVDERDFFWESNGGQPFPKVAEDVETQLQRYKAAVEEINRRTVAGHGATEGVYDPDEALRKNTEHLMSAVSSLPELQEQKKVVDKHTNIATALLGQIKARQLDHYYHMAEDLLDGKTDLQAVSKLLQGAKGTAADKQRLAAIYLLAQEGILSDNDYEALESALRHSSVDTTALAYLRTLKRNNLTGSTRGTFADPSASSQGNLLDWADKTFGQGIGQVAKGISQVTKTLLAGGRLPPLTVAVEALVDAKAGTPEFETYAVFDPKAPAGKGTLDRAKGPFREAMVFVIGGGNFLEREKLLAWAARATPSRQLIYGATEIVSGEEFLAQLAELGRRSGTA